MNLKNPFTGITDLEKLTKIYDREKKKAGKLYGGYSIKKINWLFRKYTEAININQS